MNTVHRTVVRISILCFKINTYHLLSLGGRIIGDSHFLYSGLLYVQNTLQITLHLKNLKSLSFKRIHLKLHSVYSIKIILN